MFECIRSSTLKGKSSEDNREVAADCFDTAIGKGTRFTLCTKAFGKSCASAPVVHFSSFSSPEVAAVNSQLHRQIKKPASSRRLALAKPFYSALMFDKNSPFALVLLNLSISNSIASTGDNGFKTFRSTQIRDRSSRGISSSSLRVPDR